MSGGKVWLLPLSFNVWRGGRKTERARKKKTENEKPHGHIEFYNVLDRILAGINRSTFKKFITHY